MQKYLFIDRDGTLVYEPHDYQVDSLDKVRFLKEVIPSLLRLKKAGYRFVMVSNQDGLGTSSFPLETFTPAHEFILNTLEDQGIRFDNVLVCPHRPEDDCACRKPKTGLVSSYLADPSWDRASSAVIGDRDTDLALARGMGIRGIRAGDRDGSPKGFAPQCEIAKDGPFSDSQPLSWSEIADLLCGGGRRAVVTRNTKETKIELSVDLDEAGRVSIDTGIGFFDHMLNQIASHAGFSLSVKVTGDLEVDQHHTVEDTALALGQALKEALGDKRGIGRFGFVLPMDEVAARVFATGSGLYAGDGDGTRGIDRDAAENLASVALDVSGRPHVEFSFDASLTRSEINGFETQMVPHFFESLAMAMGITLHMSVTEGNAHHQVEALFKSFGRALRPALRVVDDALPSTKGVL